MAEPTATTPKPSPARAWAEFGVGAAFLAYAAAFIYRTSFPVGGRRYFTLLDDAMISMRYAGNLARGFGLVYNPGDARVEGITNPLWTAYMALWHLLPIPAATISLAIQATGALLLLLNLYFLGRFCRLLAPGRPALAPAAAGLCAFYYPLDNWSLQGMEVAALAPLATAAAWLHLRARAAGRFSPLPHLLLAAGTWIRIDMAVPAAALLTCACLGDRARRRRHLAWGAGALAVFLASQTLWRLAYYGDPLPNTYYLKMTGFPLPFRISRGAWMAATFLWGSGWPVLLAPALLPAWRRFRRNPGVTLALALAGAQLAYSAYVGGDAWEFQGGSNRYVSIAMPPYLALLALAALEAGAGLARLWPGAGWAPVAALLALGAWGENACPAGTWARWSLAAPPLYAETNAENTRTAVGLRAITAPEARIAVVWAGAIPYFSDRFAVDLLGKNDRYLARLPARPDREGPPRWDNFFPGHMKWDYRYSFRAYAPDVIAQLWGNEEPEAAAYLKAHYTFRHLDGWPLFLRKGSAAIRWDRLSPEPATRPPSPPKP